jgi:hypothetical protein
VTVQDEVVKSEFDSTFSPRINDGGEDGFVFKTTVASEVTIAEGTLDALNLRKENITLAMLKDIRAPGLVEKHKNNIPGYAHDIIHEMLGTAKKEILAEGLFNVHDLQVQITIKYGVRKSAQFSSYPLHDGTSKKIELNFYAFKDPEFLKIVLKHELMDFKINEIEPGINPAIREIYSHLSVNIADFIALERSSRGWGTQRVITSYHGLANTSIGLYPLYLQIHNKHSSNVNDYFDDICRMIAFDGAYYPNMSDKMKELVFDGREIDEVRRSFVVNRVFHIQKNLEDYVKILSRPEELEPLEAHPGKLPEALKVFKPYADKVKYRYGRLVANGEGPSSGTEDLIYVRVEIRDAAGMKKYVHLCFHSKDKIGSNEKAVLGERGKFFNLSFADWSTSNSRAFIARPIDTDVDMRQADMRAFLYKEANAADVLNILSGGVKSPSYQKTKGLFMQVFSDLGLKENDMNFFRWSDVQRRYGPRRGCGAYYVIGAKGRGLIDRYLEKRYRPLFNGETDLLGIDINAMQIWPVTESPSVNSSIISWIRPFSRLNAPYFYSKVKKISIDHLFQVLQENRDNSVTTFIVEEAYALSDNDKKAGVKEVVRPQQLAIDFSVSQPQVFKSA